MTETDPAERRDHEADPEAPMRRREFLARTAALAGAAGLATALPADGLISQAARLQKR